MLSHFRDKSDQCYLWARQWGERPGQKGWPGPAVQRPAPSRCGSTTLAVHIPELVPHTLVQNGPHLDEPKCLFCPLVHLRAPAWPYWPTGRHLFLDFSPSLGLSSAARANPHFPLQAPGILNPVGEQGSRHYFLQTVCGHLLASILGSFLKRRDVRQCILVSWHRLSGKLGG